VWRILKKLKVNLSYDPAIALQNIYKKECNEHLIDTCTPMLIVALFTMAKQCNLSGCPPTNEWIKKM
jgi:hypothetical protein